MQLSEEIARIAILEKEIEKLKNRFTEVEENIRTREFWGDSLDTSTTINKNCYNCHSQ